jgi:uncharacterized protein (TIGR02145 family)
MPQTVTPEVVMPHVKPGESVRDIDGNIYTSVIIGNQMWTIENLRTTRFKDGTSIRCLTQWTDLDVPAYHFYHNLYDFQWGALYNWYAAGSGNLAPEGWKVPEKNDWDILVKFLIENGYNYDNSLSGNKVAISLAAKIGWPGSPIEGTPGNNRELNNTTGFTALPVATVVDQFEHGTARWWCSDDFGSDGIYFYRITDDDIGLFGGTNNKKTCGISVRLVKNMNNPGIGKITF